jgi:hypothetical protein
MKVVEEELLESTSGYVPWLLKRQLKGGLEVVGK